MRKYYGYIVLFFAFSLKAQSPFSYAHIAMESANYQRSQQILDSCKEASYFPDSIIYYRSLLTLKKGNTKNARNLCTELKAIYPQFKEAVYLSGLIYFVEEKYGKSISEFNRVVKDDPKHLKATYNRALAKGMLEDYFAAIEDLGTCIALAPGFSMAYYSRAYWYEYTGKYKESVTDYEQCLLLDPKNYDAYFGLAYVYKNLKENEKACDAINKAIKAGSQIAEEVKENFCH